MTSNKSGSKGERDQRSRLDETAALEKLKREMFREKAHLAAVKTVGSGISESKTVSVPLLALHEHLDGRHELESPPPWFENQAMVMQLIGPILNRVRKCPGSKSCFPNWREREDPEWYAQKINMLLSRVNNRISQQGDLVPALAADEAFELGSLFTEALIKFQWDQHAKRGEVTIKAAAKGGDARRASFPGRLPPDETVAAVDALLATGKPKMVAYSLVAEQQGVTQQTIAKEYQSARK